MSSTSDGERRDRIRRFFEKRLMPAAERVKARRGELFPLHPEPDADTYYRPRSRATMTRRDFELPGLDSPDALGPALARLWEQRDLPELAALATEMAGLASELREVEEADEEVSPFIYVMF